MRTIALTGGIGSGKSTVARMFNKLNVPIYDSDTEAKTLLDKSKKLRKAMISLLGEESYSNHRLNKKYIAARVFKDKELLQKMNRIVHPAVRQHFLNWAVNQKAPYVIQEAAIIFESGNYNHYDAIILVTAPENYRIERVMNRDASTKEQILARIENQWGDEDKIPLCDYVIQNVTLKETAQQVSKIHNALLKIR